ncbi:ABC transporter permease [Candidatus Aerophobetes bacterium Ae_b3b]|nr:MAG: ABC transporter permease [Candidatus Aerophobetes bacterium Ae_b3b]
MRKLVFLLPAIGFLIAVIIIPYGYMIKYSFTAYNLALPRFSGQFIGLENYRKFLGEPAVWKSLKLTLWFCFLAVSVEFVFGLGGAILLNKDFRAKRFIMSFIIIPSMLSPISVALIWRFLLMPHFGTFLYYLARLGIVESVDMGIFSTAGSAFYTLVLIDVWQWTPLIILILAAGLVSLPKEPFEAALVDGASALQIFKNVTLPLLKPTIALAILFRLITVLKTFDKVYLLTKGGPGSATEILNMYSYRINFIRWDFGYGSTITLFILFIAFTATILLLKAMESVKSA